MTARRMHFYCGLSLQRAMSKCINVCLCELFAFEAADMKKQKKIIRDTFDQMSKCTSFRKALNLLYDGGHSSECFKIAFITSCNNTLQMSTGRLTSSTYHEFPLL